MSDENIPWSKERLLTELEQHHTSFKEELHSLDPSAYDFCWKGKWTAGQQLRHIQLSVKPVVLALRLPRFMIQWKFGLANRSSSTYDGLVQKYLRALDGMLAEAPRAFQPPEEKHKSSGQLFSEYEKTLDNLLKQVQKITDKDLERYVLPHPLIGKLTLKEMLYFTVYHVQHHHDIVRQIIEQANASIE